MIRKLILALGATAALGAAALAPTTASAWHGHHGHHGHWHGGSASASTARPISPAPDCYIVRRQVQLADGSWRWRRVTVCD